MLHTKETKPFYGTAAWKACREAALRRDGGFCRACLAAGRFTTDRAGRRVPVLATVVHHVQHLEDRPDLALELSNLVSLCDRCHDAAHPEKHAGHQPADPIPEVARGIRVERL